MTSKLSHTEFWIWEYKRRNPGYRADYLCIMQEWEDILSYGDYKEHPKDLLHMHIHHLDKAEELGLTVHAPKDKRANLLKMIGNFIQSMRCTRRILWMD